MALSLVATIRNAMANALRDAIDAGSGPGLLRIYDGTRPALGGTATTLLAEIALNDPCAPDASGGVLTFSGMPRNDTAANATGTATWGRYVDSDGTTCGDFDVGTSGSDLNLATTSLVEDVVVSITSLTWTAPNA